MRRACILGVGLFLALSLSGPHGPGVAQATAIGDTLTIIQRPLLNIPAIVVPGDTLIVACQASSSTSGWTVQLEHGSFQILLEVYSASYDATTLWWSLAAGVPEAAEIPLYELYDLVVHADGGVQDRTRNAVRVIPALRDDYYFIHLTDTHLPTDLYYDEPGAQSDSSEIADLRAVIADVNLINPEFVVLTGDLIHEGELEDYLERRYYTRAQRVLTEFKVPLYLTSGNHDIGGWDGTPPPDGTARRDWWRFFGWKRLDNPPPGAPWHTQNYSFDYGPVHYSALEAYDNYDGFRYSIYGATSFISEQLQWLAADLAQAGSSSARVLLYHYDFANQINLNNLQVDLALWGHIHRDDGNINDWPCDLGTDNVCSGARSFRLVRVIDGEVYPELTMAAGSSGERLRVVYVPANDGTNDTVTASILNNHAVRFQNGLLRFQMPPGPGQYQVTNGTLLQCDSSGAVTICYVGVDIPASAARTVTIIKEASGVEEPEIVAGLSLWLNSPNPFARVTEFGYALPASGQARLAVYAVDGREVIRLVDAWKSQGSHFAPWDARDTYGDRVPAGIYFAKLTAGGAEVTRKVILAH
jgi:hypothetical protein